MLFARLLRRRWVRVALIAVLGTASLGSLNGCIYNYGRGGHYHRW